MEPCLSERRAFPSIAFNITSDNFIPGAKPCAITQAMTTIARVATKASGRGSIVLAGTNAPISLRADATGDALGRQSEHQRETTAYCSGSSSAFFWPAPAEVEEAG